jgi:hypothetical protein
MVEKTHSKKLPVKMMIGKHRPDLIVVNGRVKIIEVETKDTINSTHLKSRARI